METEISEQWWKVSRAARELGVDTAWVYRAAQRGQLVAAEIGGLVVLRTSVLRVKAERERTAAQTSPITA
jgi:hypothetical protein